MEFNKEQLYEEHGIIKIDENIWYVLEHEANSKKSEDYSLVKAINLEDLVVNDGDVLAVTMIDESDENLFALEIYNVINDTFGYVKGDYFSDDGRYYTVNGIASLFKDKDVIVKNFLIYDDELLKKYLESFEE